MDIERAMEISLGLHVFFKAMSPIRRGKYHVLMDEEHDREFMTMVWEDMKGDPGQYTRAKLEVIVDKAFKQFYGD